MSRYFSHKYDALTPYKPGEQPGEKQYTSVNVKYKGQIICK